MGIGLIVFLFLDKNIYCGKSLEAPHKGASNEYLQHRFLSRNKKNTDTVWLKMCLYIKSCVYIVYRSSSAILDSSSGCKLDLL